MKSTEYTVIYLNGNEEKFYCFGFMQAIVLGQALAISKGWDMRIKYVSELDGPTIRDIEPATYTFSK